MCSLKETFFVRHLRFMYFTPVYSLRIAQVEGFFDFVADDLLCRHERRSVQYLKADKKGDDEGLKQPASIRLNDMAEQFLESLERFMTRMAGAEHYRWTGRLLSCQPVQTS